MGTAGPAKNAEERGDMSVAARDGKAKPTVAGTHQACQSLGETVREGTTGAGREAGVGLRAQQLGMLHLLQTHTAFPGVAPGEPDTVKKPGRANCKVNRMTKMFFTAPAHTFERSD
jgi:hypothetical protein